MSRDGFRWVVKGFQRGFKGFSMGSETFGVFRMPEMSV